MAESGKALCYVKFCQNKQTRKNILRPPQIQWQCSYFSQGDFSTVIINPQEGGIYKCHKSARQAKTGHASSQPAQGREVMRRNHFFQWRLNPIKDNNELMTRQDFSPKGNGIRKSKMGLMTGQILAQNKLSFAQCAQLLLMLVRGTDWSLRLKWLHI